MKKYRLPLIFAALFALWLAFGNQILNQIGLALLSIDSAPPLEGHLLYSQDFEGIWQFDLASNQISVWWTPPEGGMVTGIAASPDGSQLAVAYAPPAEEGFQIGTTDLYLSPLDVPDLQPLFVRADRNESYRNPVWSLDSETLYFTHLQPVYRDDGSSASISLNIERLRLPDSGNAETVIEGAEQAAQSPDGKKITYIKFDPVSYGKALWVMNNDGSDAQRLVPAGAFFDLASPLFSPDGQSLVFSGSGEYQAVDAAAWWRASTAFAHGLPWNVWKIDLSDSSMQA
jgi:Tol biopolymer transport system component